MDWFDRSLYPDAPEARTPEDHGEKIDFIARLCGAWDFGILPWQETIEEIRKPGWRQAVEDCRMLSSASYHLLREWHDLTAEPYLGSIPAYIRDDPELQRV